MVLNTPLSLENVILFWSTILSDKRSTEFSLFHSFLAVPSHFSILIINHPKGVFLWHTDLSDCSKIGNHNYLVCSKTLDNLASFWPDWLNEWVLFCEVSECGFESRCSHLTFRYRSCFQQRVPWHSDD